MKLFAKQSSSGDGRVFRSGVWSAAIAAAVIVLAVLVNLIVRAIPSRYTEFDLSEAGLYTLSESSRQVADDLTQDVAIYYLAQTGNEDQIISKLLDQYAAQSSHITWELKDPAVYPTFAAQYGVQDLTSGGLILVCGEQSKVLDAAELYDYDYSDYAATGAANVTFDGESRITSAIYQLTSGESRHVYYTTNHGEQALTSTLTDALESQNLTVSALDLLSQTIPEDCDLLVINDLAQDFSGAGSLVDELGQLRSYLSNGGRVLLLTDSYYSTPNLDAVMAEFGLTRTEGLVVEGDNNHYLNGYPALYLLPDYASTEESTALDGVNTSRRVLLQMAQGITLTETEHVVSDALLVSSDSAYSKPEGYEMTTTEKADGDIAGPFTLAAYARNEDTGAQVIWVNCGNMDNEGIYQVIPGNVTFLQARHWKQLRWKCQALPPLRWACSLSSFCLRPCWLWVPWWSCCGAESEDLSMKAKQRTLGVLLFLILLAGGVFALLTLRNAREEQAASAAADGTIPLAAVSGNDLTQVVLHYQDETNTLLYTADGWTLAEDPAYHLDTSACNTMLTALSSLNAKQELSPQAGEDYGFAEPALTIEVTAAGETETYTFGASNTMTGDLYARKNDSDTIYTVSGTKAACFELTRAELFGAFNPAGLTASEIEAVSYTLADGETVTLKANSEPAAESGSNAYQTVWRLAGDTAADLDETKVDAILSALCAYVSAQATDADPAAYGFEAPLVTAEVATADGTINLTYAMGTDGCYLMVEGDSSVYTVDASVVSALLYPADQLKAE